VTDAGPERCRAHSASPQWVGIVIADALDIPLEFNPETKAVAKCPGKAKLVTMLAAWIENDILRTEQRMVGKSENKLCVVAGPRVEEAG
jgi:hypothetical protein